MCVCKGCEGKARRACCLVAHAFHYEGVHGFRSFHELVSVVGGSIRVVWG
jgi:hypothetical protein